MALVRFGAAAASCWLLCAVLDGSNGVSNGPSPRTAQLTDAAAGSRSTAAPANGPGWIERPEDEVVPAFRHAAGRRAVERLDAGAGHSPAVRDRRGGGDGQQRRPGPG